jgi:hypothetical protein
MALLSAMISEVAMPGCRQAKCMRLDSVLLFAGEKKKKKKKKKVWVACDVRTLRALGRLCHVQLWGNICV